MQSSESIFENIRKDFPILKRKVRDNKSLVYLDNASTTQKPNHLPAETALQVYPVKIDNNEIFVEI